jgi:hypothetical protein
VARRFAFRLLGNHEAALLQQRIVVARKHARQVAPAVRRVTEPEVRRDLPGQATALQVVDRPRARLQLLAIGLGRAREHLRQRRPALLLRARLVALGSRQVVVRHRHAHLTGQILHRIDEAHPAVLGQELDRIAARAAAEAVIELLARADREARRFLGMERAQPAEVRAAFLQLHVAADDLDDVDAREQVLDEAGRDHPEEINSPPTYSANNAAAGCASPL